MADIVEDTVIIGTTNDPVLAILLNIMIRSAQTQRPVFQNPLDEPVIFRRLMNVVEQAIGSRDAIDNVEEEIRQRIHKGTVGEG